MKSDVCTVTEILWVENKWNEDEWNCWEVTEDEESIDSMVTGEEIKENFMVNHRFKISEVMEKIDDVIGEATGERVDDVMNVLETLSDKEQSILLERLKKKI